MHPLTFTLVWLLPEAMTREQYLAPDTRAALFTGGRFGAVEVGRIRAVLLVAQVAVTAALLYVCALTVHSFAAVSAVELGFSEDRIVGLQMPAPVRQFSGPREERRTRFERQVQLAFDTRDAIRALPGVAGAAVGPVGQRVQGPRRTWRIAAVVSDVASERPDRPVAPEVLVLTDELRAQLVVRLAEDANTHAARAAIAATFERVWPEKASRDVVPVAALVAVARADYMSRALVLTIIGILCVPLAVAGVAGAAAFSVQRRAREIAIRLALGASHSPFGPLSCTRRRSSWASTWRPASAGECCSAASSDRICSASILPIHCVWRQRPVRCSWSPLRGRGSRHAVRPPSTPLTC